MENTETRQSYQQACQHVDFQANSGEMHMIRKGSPPYDETVPLERSASRVTRKTEVILKELLEGDEGHRMRQPAYKEDLRNTTSNRGVSPHGKSFYVFRGGSTEYRKAGGR